MIRDEDYWRSVVRELVALPAETGWLEFKHNNGARGVPSFLFALCAARLYDQFQFA